MMGSRPAMPVPLLNFVSSADGAENIRSLVLTTSILNKGEGENERGGVEEKSGWTAEEGSDLKFEIRTSRVERGQI